MYRKLKADKLFTGSTLLDQSAVLITKQDGTIADIVSLEEAGDDVETFRGILSPGFINCHCHIELSYLKNKIPQHTGLVDFVQMILSNRAVDPEVKRQAMELAQNELYESGTVAVGDICNDTASIAIKENSPLYWMNFIEVSGFVNSTADQRFSAAKQVAEKFEKLPFPFAIVPHAPYSVSENLFRLINDHSKEFISIHNQEHSDEDILYINKQGGFLKLYQKLGVDIAGFKATGKTSLQSWLPYFTHGQRIISVHNTFTSQADIDFAGNIHYCICINANLYIENKIPPVELLMQNKSKIVIGTDSYASNHMLNMLEEMRTIQNNFPDIKIETILQWATKNGAEALGISGSYGSFERGKNPGVVLIENSLDNLFSENTSARPIRF